MYAGADPANQADPIGLVCDCACSEAVERAKTKAYLYYLRHRKDHGVGQVTGVSLVCGGLAIATYELPPVSVSFGACSLGTGYASAVSGR